MSTSSFKDNEATNSQLTILGTLLHRTILAASQGQILSTEEREALSMWLRGEAWSLTQPAKDPEEAQLIKSQVMLMGPELRKALAGASRNGQLSREDRRELHEWLYSTRRLQRRYNRRRRLFYIFYTVGVAAVVLLVRSYIPYGGLATHPLWIPFILAVSILVGAIVKDFYLDRNVETALSDIKRITEKSKEDLRDILERDLRPRIIALDTRAKVLRAASDILFEALQEPKEHRFVMFIGAASLSTQKPVGKREEDEHKMTLVEEYNTRLLNLEGAKVPVKRYVAMIDPKDSHKRKPETWGEYISWVEKQIGHLKDHEKYTLIDCYRAQPWGGSRSSIITHKAFLDIVGEGTSGFLVRGEEVARSLKQGCEALFETANQHSYSGSDDKEIEKLEELLGKLKATR